LRVLLDTHAFVWWNSDDPRLSRTARAVIQEPENEILLSAASAWEIAIKYARGRLPIPQPPARYVADRMRRHGFGPLAIEIAHGVQVGSLPPIHRDPFDRILVAQSQLENLPILTSDPNIARYGVSVIW